MFSIDTDERMVKGAAPTSLTSERSHHQNITSSFEGRVALPVASVPNHTERSPGDIHPVSLNDTTINMSKCCHRQASMYIFKKL
jgi:hypothetical protein